MANNFTSEDLTLNKKGKLSVAQKQTMEKKLDGFERKTKKMKMAVMVIAIVGFGFELIYDFEKFKKMPIYFWLILGVFFLAYSFWANGTFQSVKKKMLADKIPVKAINGPLKIEKYTQDNYWLDKIQMLINEDVTTVNSVKVGGKTFYTDEETSSSLENGKNYGIYFIDYKFPIIVSWEKITI